MAHSSNFGWQSEKYIYRKGEAHATFFLSILFGFSLAGRGLKNKLIGGLCGKFNKHQAY
jgi:hypothetical protein